MKYSEKTAIKIAKLVGLNPPDISNVTVEIIKKTIDEAMREQKFADIQAVNSLTVDNFGCIKIEDAIDRINSASI